MREKQITAYFCGHCNKLYQIKSACEKHETFCKKNPANNHKCFQWCKHLKMVKGYFDEGEYFHDRIWNDTEFTCKKRDCTMWSYIAERRGINHCADERMPLECEHYDSNVWEV